MSELVSIITPLFNSSKYIGLTIDSVLAQTCRHWEMIVVDDGSTDGSHEIVEEYAKRDNRIRLLSQEHSGSAIARNSGIRSARGRYLAFLDSDDIWEPEFLECQLRLLEQTGGQLVCSAHRRIDEDGEECLHPFYPPVEAGYEDLLRTCSISCLTVVYDTCRFGKIYLPEQYSHREEFKLREDYILWLDVIKKVGVVYGNQQVLASYRIRRSQKTANKWKTICPQFMVYRRVEKIGFVRSLYYLVCWAVAGIKKYIN